MSDLVLRKHIDFFPAGQTLKPELTNEVLGILVHANVGTSLLVSAVARRLYAIV